MKPLHLISATGMALALTLSSLPCAAQTKEALDAGVLETVKQFEVLDPRHRQLERQAAGMLVFPQIIKGGIGLASEYGAGSLWMGGSAVDYYSVASASFGLTAGMASHSEVILFMTQDALDKFTRSRGWSVGADTGVVLVTKGMMDDYETYKRGKPVLVFWFAEKGLLADLSLQGTKVNKIAKLK